MVPYETQKDSDFCNQIEILLGFVQIRFRKKRELSIAHNKGFARRVRYNSLPNIT